MEDLNLIACLFPADDDPRRGHALRAISMSENRSRYIVPRQEAREEEESRSRESTVSLDGNLTSASSDFSTFFPLTAFTSVTLNPFWVNYAT